MLRVFQDHRCAIKYRHEIKQVLPISGCTLDLNKERTVRNDLPIAVWHLWTCSLIALAKLFSTGF